MLESFNFEFDPKPLNPILTIPYATQIQYRRFTFSFSIKKNYLCSSNHMFNINTLILIEYCCYNSLDKGFYGECATWIVLENVWYAEVFCGDVFRSLRCFDA